MSKEPKPPIRERLRSALNRDLPRPPEPPAPTFQAWSNPDAAYTPSEAEQRVAGAIAWAEREVPDPPQCGPQHVTGGGR